MSNHAQSQNLPTAESLEDFITPDELVSRYPDKFTKPQFTWLLRNRHTNGLQEAGAVSMVSKKFYVNVPRFTAWLASQNI